MTELVKLSKLEIMTGETDSAVLSVYLELAESVVLRRLYPFGAENKALPEQYEPCQLRIAAYLVNKRGAEGETAHSENGISRSYEDGDIPPSLLRELIPYARVFGKGSGADADNGSE